jgi:hypothetical protein
MGGKTPTQWLCVTYIRVPSLTSIGTLTPPQYLMVEGPENLRIPEAGWVSKAPTAGPVSPETQSHAKHDGVLRKPAACSFGLAHGVLCFPTIAIWINI